MSLIYGLALVDFEESFCFLISGFFTGCFPKFGFAGGTCADTGGVMIGATTIAFVEFDPLINHLTFLV